MSLHRIAPRARQESVWDFPRPPAVRPDRRRVRVVLGGVTIVDTREAVRVLETSHPPAWYLPVEAFTGCRLEPSSRSSFCEYKGRATYVSLVAGVAVAVDAGWTYRQPAEGYAALAGRIALYPGRVDRCLVDDEEVVAQPGDFYGGWITGDVVGPFKGSAGTSGW